MRRSIRSAVRATAALAAAVGTLAVFGAAQSGGRATVPAAADRAAAHRLVARELAALLVDDTRGAAAFDALAARANAVDATAEPALRWAWLDTLVDVALAAHDLERALGIEDARAEEFATDGVRARAAALRRAATLDGIAPTRLVFAHAHAARRVAVDDGDAAGVDALARGADAHSDHVADPGVARWWAAERERLRRIVAARTALDSATDRVAFARFLCRIAGDFERGLPPLAAAPDTTADDALTEAARIAASGDAATATDRVHAAELLLRDARAADDDLVAENLIRHALSEFRRAWPELPGEHADRVRRRLDRLEDELAASSPLGNVDFAGPAPLDRVVCTGDGDWAVVDARLVGLNRGPATRSTLATAWRHIDAVTIRGTILSRANLNFRFAVGSLNAIANWEVAPENHVWLGDTRAASSPPWFRSGEIHDLRIRQCGALVVAFVDGTEVFRAPGSLRGTVSVYPALGSEIAVERIHVLGRPDPATVVTGPSHAAR